MDAGQIARQLAEQADQVAPYLLTNGKRQGREWCVGNVAGEAGKSLKVCLAGKKAGVWADFATGEKGDLLDLWCAVRGKSLSEALREARAYLGVCPPEKLFPRPKSFRKPGKPKGLVSPQSQVLNYLHSRGLTEKSIDAYRVGEVSEKGKEPGPWIVFPFFREDELVSTKFLHLEREKDKKKIRAESGCEPVLFGMHVIPENQRSLPITEGEFDAMSLFEYDTPAVSVPFGAGTGAKHAWIEQCWEWLERFSEILLCLDGDPAGLAAAEEIARRLGLHRCKLVVLPHKDVNACLTAGMSKEEIDRCFAEAVTFDPEELKSAGFYVDGVINRIHPTGDKRPGIDLPWCKTQGRIRLYDGEVTIWTGINGHGKSLLLGQVMLAAAQQEHSCCIFSGEMHPEKTLGRMVRQHTGLETPSVDEIRQALGWMTGSVWIFDLVGAAKQDRLFEVFTYAFHRYGIRQFVIDSLAKIGMAEDDYGRQKSFIEALGDFAKSTGCHVHLVAHARKGADELSPPGKMDVKGTGALTDMVDNVLCVYRNKAKERNLAILDNGGTVKGKTRSQILDEYDAFLICDKHREEGADAEGMYGLYFDRQGQRFVESQS